MTGTEIGLGSTVSFNAHGQDLKVVAPNAVKEAVVEIAARFEKDTGRRVSLT